MPKRIGYLWEKVCTYENCLSASRNVEVSHYGKIQSPLVEALVIRRAKNVQRVLTEMSWVPMGFKRKTILDGRRGKVRILRIPTQFDQTIHHAIMNVLKVEILKRNHYYNCGSIPDAGQSRACKCVRTELRKHRYKYAFQWDYKKYYQNLGHDAVLNAFKRFIKDSKMLWGIESILMSMLSLDEISERLELGLHEIAIGFNPSHWFANAVNNYIISQLILKYPKEVIVQYMDDGLALGNNKRRLHKFCKTLQDILSKLGLVLKSNYQVYKVAGRGIRYLSYAFYHDYTLVRKYLLYKLTRVISRGGKLTEHFCQSLLSRLGILKHCNSYNIQKRFVYPAYEVKDLKGVVSNAQKSRNLLLEREACRDSVPPVLRSQPDFAIS